MPVPPELNNLPMNPEYGTGIYRRRIRLQGEPGRVIAELEDCNHGFRALIYHDGQRVTAIEPEMLRIPLTTCPGALAPIQALVGTELSADIRTISAEVNPRTNCTHLYDLSVLAIHHCLRGETLRQYDVAVPDASDGPIEATVTRDGELVLSWTLHEWRIQNEGPVQGKSLFAGFGAWASKLYTGETKEAAFILQKGYFVSNARQFDLSKLAGLPMAVAEGRSGVCYSHTPGIIETAVRTSNSARDFTDTPEQLLRFT